MCVEVTAAAVSSAFVNQPFLSRFRTGTVRLLLRAAIVTIFPLNVLLAVTDAQTTQNRNEDSIDHSIKPGDDFYHYA